ncbi:MAG: hypothetical protein Q8880_00425 [Bacteroidota bacterium]|nr:hypothetical protein [Bacteroidota bacterium]
MAHQETTENLSKEQITFNDYIRRGDDFVRIQIYRNALEWYNLALQMGIDNSIPKRKISECKEKINGDNKIIAFVLFLAAIVLSVVFIVNH